jgi:hypothetical protein
MADVGGDAVTGWAQCTALLSQVYVVRVFRTIWARE